MILAPERIAAACDLGPAEGAELLGRARAGDVEAMADWIVYAVMTKVRRSGSSPVKAKADTIEFMSRVDVIARSH